MLEVWDQLETIGFGTSSLVGSVFEISKKSTADVDKFKTQ